MTSFRRSLYVLIPFTIIVVYVFSTVYKSRYVIAERTSSQLWTCPSVLSHMTTGHWKTRPLSQNEEEEITLFLFGTKPHEPLSSKYSRKDGLCGNVRSDNYVHSALCDPIGDKPCCANNHCVRTSVQDCVCKTCYDLRKVKHAEYSTWMPSHPMCQYRHHTPREACGILNGMKLVFVGDSYVRHIYTALLLVLSGDFKYGALLPTANRTIKTECQGMYVFAKKICRSFLPESQTFCNGSVKLFKYYYPNHSYGRRLEKIAMNLPDKSYIFAGIGIHNGYNLNAIQKTFLGPLLDYLKNKNRKVPKLVWVATHAHGAFKGGLFVTSNDQKVQPFNSAMKKYLKPMGISVFDTYNLTHGMMSYDNSHYGIGVNVVKSNILLSYLREQKVNFQTSNSSNTHITLSRRSTH